MLCVCVSVCRGRSTHPGSIVHLSDNPVDVNRVSIYSLWHISVNGCCVSLKSRALKNQILSEKWLYTGDRGETFATAGALVISTIIMYTMFPASSFWHFVSALKNIYQRVRDAFACLDVGDKPQILTSYSENFISPMTKSTKMCWIQRQNTFVCEIQNVAATQIVTF